MTEAEKTVDLYTDGACKGNPGPGGWGVLLRYGGAEKSLCGGERETTNNRMELRAVIEGLLALTKPSLVDLYSDSQYVLKGLKEWMPNWKKNGWRTSDKKPVKNKELWEQLDKLKHIHDLRFHWVKGHNEHPENERCDQLAVAAAKAAVAEGR